MGIGEAEFSAGDGAGLAIRRAKKGQVMGFGVDEEDDEAGASGARKHRAAGSANPSETAYEISHKTCELFRAVFVQKPEHAAQRFGSSRRARAEDARREFFPRKRRTVLRCQGDVLTMRWMCAGGVRASDDGDGTKRGSFLLFIRGQSTPYCIRTTWPQSAFAGPARPGGAATF